jgi:uncharacterized protein (DUF2141 family)
MKTLILAYLLLICSLAGAQQAGELSVTITNIHPPKGELFVAIYDDPGNYMNPDAACRSAVNAVVSDTLQLTFRNMKADTYAIAVFQDLNGNGLLDTGGKGIPLEPFGFSNDARGKLGPAKYKNASFIMNEDMHIRIKLVNNAEPIQ